MRPKVYIAHSKEASKLARSLIRELHSYAECLIDENAFKRGVSFVDNVLAIARTFDFAVVLLTPDDVVTSRGVQSFAPRDNLLFEAGLFYGLMGPERTFLLVPRNCSEFKLPTNIGGITFVHYDHNFQNCDDAIRGASIQISDILSEKSVPVEVPVEAVEVSNVKTSAPWSPKLQHLVEKGIVFGRDKDQFIISARGRRSRKVIGASGGSWSPDHDAWTGDLKFADRVIKNLM